MFRRTLFAALLLGLVCSYSSAALVADTSNPSDSYLISNVNANGGLQVGNLLFSNFVVTSQGSVNAVVPDVSLISITGVLINGDYGLRFDGGWSASPGQISSSSINFKVSTLDSSLIYGNDLWIATYGVTNINSTQNGHVGIAEVIYDSDPGAGSLNTINDNEHVFFYDSTINKLSDSDTFDTGGYGEIWVNKGVTVNGGVGGFGFAQLNQFYQLYDQAPEPASMFALLIGSGAMIFRKRK